MSQSNKMRNHEAELKIFTEMLNDKIIAMFDSVEKRPKKGKRDGGKPRSFILFVYV